MNVGELRKALEGVSDETQVVTCDLNGNSYLTPRAAGVARHPDPPENDPGPAEGYPKEVFLLAPWPQREVRAVSDKSQFRTDGGPVLAPAKKQTA